MEVKFYVNWEEQRIFTEEEKQEWIDEATESYMDYENSCTGGDILSCLLEDYNDQELFFMSDEKREEVMEQFQQNCRDEAESNFYDSTTEESLTI